MCCQFPAHNGAGETCQESRRERGEGCGLQQSAATARKDTAELRRFPLPAIVALLPTLEELAEKPRFCKHLSRATCKTQPQGGGLSRSRVIPPNGEAQAVTRRACRAEPGTLMPPGVKAIRPV